MLPLCDKSVFDCTQAVATIFYFHNLLKFDCIVYNCPVGWLAGRRNADKFHSL